jgi:hypothetical protein
VTAILYNSLGDEQHLSSALESTSQIQDMAAENLISQQYLMAAVCEAAETHLKLAQLFSGRIEKSAAYPTELARALECSQTALRIYRQFGFVQLVECTSEEILYRHSQALAAHNRADEATDFLEQAYAEMMRKYDLIPAESPFRKTYLENIELHREIQLAYAARSTRPILSRPNQERSR